METELSLQEIKTVTLDILTHFDDFCKQHNIRFFLSNGTLLGAVKYGGFIPWDDDVDVMVPREDYDRLIALYRDSDRFRLFSPEREAAFRFPFAKLCDMTTRKEEHNTDNGVALGLDIDIFPLDRCTEHILQTPILMQLRTAQVGCVLSKFRDASDKPLAKRLVIAYCRRRGFAHFHKRLAALVKREGRRGHTHGGCLMWPIYGEREIMDAAVFADGTEVTFEGRTFAAPIGYDIYLRRLYGDYEQDPPPDKQKTHHHYRAVRV